MVLPGAETLPTQHTTKEFVYHRGLLSLAPLPTSTVINESQPLGLQYCFM